MEIWLSGLKQQFAKLSVHVNGPIGSNPIISTITSQILYLLTLKHLCNIMFTLS